MTLDIFTPLASGNVVELGNKVWRKQVLPLTEIQYGDRRLRFDRDYIDNVVAAFKAGAFDTVPFVLAGADNSHTMAAENGGHGEVLDMLATDDGLYADFRLSETAEELVRNNPRFGVSVRLKEFYERPDGTHYPAACQHVLGTWDPKIAGMKPWQQVELSHTPGSAVIDLSGLTYKEEGAVPDTTKKTPPAPQDDAPPAWFSAWLAAGAPGIPAAQQAPDGEDTTTDEQDDETEGEGIDQTNDATADGDADAELTDDEFMAQIEGLFEPEETEEPATVAASQSGGDSVELANVARDERLAAVELSNRQLQARLDAANYATERAQLVRLSGLTPADIDLARPLLEGAGRTVELSNGDSVDAGEIVRSLLKRFGETVRLLDLSGEIGVGIELSAADDAEQAEKERAAKADAFVSGIG